MQLPVIRRCRPLLGTLVEVAVPEADAQTIDAAFAVIARVQNLMSFHSEESDLARLRRSRNGEAVRVDRATVDVLRIAARLHAQSDGLFDVTVAQALVNDGFLPCPPGIDSDSLYGTAADIELVDDEHVRCHAPMLIDLGGIAKGYAVDMAIGRLADGGVERALINAGGDLRVLGHAAQPIHLRAADGRPDRMLILADAALASSANLHDRRAGVSGITVPHRGRDGKAVPSDQAVSVIAPTCGVADAMTKVVLAEPTLGAAMLAELGGRIVDRDSWPLAS